MRDRQHPPHQRALMLEMMLPLQLTFAAEDAQAAAEAAKTCPHPSRYRYPTMTKTLDNFTLNVVEGEITATQIVVALGRKGSGLKTFLDLLAGILEPDEVDDGSDAEMPNFNVSTMPQDILISMSSSSLNTVRDILLLHEIRHSFMMNPKFVHNVMEPLHINNLLMDKLMKDLSPAELQSLALCICLGKPADIYLLESPFTFLDPVQSVDALTAVKWFIRHEKKAAVVIEPNLFLAFELADRFIVTEGEPFVHCTANAPMSVLEGGELHLSQFDFDDKERRFPIEFMLDLKKLELESTTKGGEQISAGFPLELESTTKGREQKAVGSFSKLELHILNLLLELKLLELESSTTGGMQKADGSSSVDEQRSTIELELDQKILEWESTTKGREWMILERESTTKGREQKTAGSSAAEI